MDSRPTGYYQVPKDTTCEWETPQDLFNSLNSEFRFTLDVCVNSKNAKCEKYITPEVDGLKLQWSGVCWMNPPYGREIGKWIRKALIESLRGITVVCLLPAKTDTTWWHDYVLKADEIRYIKGRLKFGNSTENAPFPSAIVIYKGIKILEDNKLFW